MWVKTCNLEKQETAYPICFKRCDENNDIIPIYGRVEEKEGIDIPKRPMEHRPEAVTYTMQSSTGDRGYDTVEGFSLFNRHIIVHTTSQILSSLTIDENAIIVETGQTRILSRSTSMLICHYSILLREK